MFYTLVKHSFKPIIARVETKLHYNNQYISL